MFSREYFEVLSQVLSSWHVIAVTVVLLIYMFIVSHVVKYHRRPKVKKIKVKKMAAASIEAGPEVSEGGGDTNDELGLEDA